MREHQLLTLEECLVEYNAYMSQKIEEAFGLNVSMIKNHFDTEVREKAVKPITYDELARQCEHR